MFLIGEDPSGFNLEAPSSSPVYCNLDTSESADNPLLQDSLENASNINESIAEEDGPVSETLSSLRGQENHNNFDSFIKSTQEEKQSSVGARHDTEVSFSDPLIYEGSGLKSVLSTQSMLTDVPLSNSALPQVVATNTFRGRQCHPSIENNSVISIVDNRGGEIGSGNIPSTSNMRSQASVLAAFSEEPRLAGSLQFPPVSSISCKTPSVVAAVEKPTDCRMLDTVLPKESSTPLVSAASPLLIAPEYVSADQKSSTDPCALHLASDHRSSTMLHPEHGHDAFQQGVKSMKDVENNNQMSSTTLSKAKIRTTSQKLSDNRDQTRRKRKLENSETHSDEGVKKRFSYQCNWPDCGFRFHAKSLLDNHLKSHISPVLLSSSDLMSDHTELEKFCEFWEDDPPKQEFNDHGHVLDTTADDKVLAVEQHSKISLDVISQALSSSPNRCNTNLDVKELELNPVLTAPASSQNISQNASVSIVKKAGSVFETLPSLHVQSDRENCADVSNDTERLQTLDYNKGATKICLSEPPISREINLKSIASPQSKPTDISSIYTVPQKAATETPRNTTNSSMTKTSSIYSANCSLGNKGKINTVTTPYISIIGNPIFPPCVTSLLHVPSVHVTAGTPSLKVPVAMKPVGASGITLPVLSKQDFALPSHQISIVFGPIFPSFDCKSNTDMSVLSPQTNHKVLPLNDAQNKISTPYVFNDANLHNKGKQLDPELSIQNGNTSKQFHPVFPTAPAGVKHQEIPELSKNKRRKPQRKKDMPGDEGEKNLLSFKCPVADCHYASHRKHDVIRHSMIHTDERPFECKLCNTNFNRKDKLYEHFRTRKHQRRKPQTIHNLETRLNDNIVPSVNTGSNAG